MEQAVQAGIIIFSLSAGTIYLLRASELLVQLCNAFDFALSADEAHILFGIICFVLSSAKQVYSIRTISMCSVLSVFYLVGLSIVHCSLRLTTQEVAFDDHLRRENVNLFYGSMTGILKAFPMMIFAFAAQMAVPSILDGMSQEYRHRKIERMLFAKRKRVARALVIRRGQIFGSTDAPPKRKGNKFRLFGKKAAAKALSPSLLQDNLSSVRKDELQRLGGASVQQLAKAKLETLDPQQMTSLRARGPKRMTRAQIVFLSQCSLETLTFRELELLAHLPLESFSNEELAEATKNPVQAAMRFDRSLVVRPTEMGQGAVSAVPPEIRRRVPGSTKPTETSNPALLTLPNDQVSPLPAAMPGLPAEAKVESFESVSMIAVAVGTFVNLAVGFCGALVYGAKTQSNILVNYKMRVGVDTAWVAVAFGCFFFHICTVFPLILFPCRTALLAMTVGQREISRVTLLEQKISANSLRKEDVIACAGRIWKCHRLTEAYTLLFCTLCVLIALRVGDFAAIFELSRGTAFAFVCYIFPVIAAMNLNLVQDSVVDSCLAVLVTGVGIGAGILWTWSAWDANFHTHA
mmetsp:Transcript_1433/g.6280  ORF Transcript_1433/g.6280 Transcript_1433/m.6280 type:complete len:577 (-) Transcript_1433:222-1952(-)